MAEGHGHPLVVGIIRRFCGDFFERITHLISDFSQGTCAELGSMFLGVWEKKTAKRTKTGLGAVVASVNQKVARPCRRREPTAESETSGSPV